MICFICFESKRIFYSDNQLNPQGLRPIADMSDCSYPCKPSKRILVGLSQKPTLSEVVTDSDFFLYFSSNISFFIYRLKYRPNWHLKLERNFKGLKILICNSPTALGPNGRADVEVSWESNLSNAQFYFLILYFPSPFEMRSINCPYFKMQ